MVLAVMAEVDSVTEAVEEGKEEVAVKEAQVMRGKTNYHFTVTIVENQATKKHIVGKSKRMRPKKSILLRNQEEDSKLFMVVCSKREKPNDIRFLDGGCSNHMFGRRSSFKELDESKKSEVTPGSNKKIQVEGRGTIRITGSKGNMKILQEVMLVPILSRNLLSIRQLMTSGYSILFDDGHGVTRDNI